MKPNMVFARQLGKLLKRAMHDTSHTQESLAELTGLSQPTISRMLGGWTTADLANVLIVLVALGKDMQWLVDSGLPMPCVVRKCTMCGIMRSRERPLCHGCGELPYTLLVWLSEVDVLSER